MYQAFFKWQGISGNIQTSNWCISKHTYFSSAWQKKIHSCCRNVRYQKWSWIVWHLQNQTWPYIESTCWEDLATVSKIVPKEKNKNTHFYTFQGSRQPPCFIPKIWTIIFNLSLSSRSANSAFSNSAFSICCSKEKLTFFSTHRKVKASVLEPDELFQGSVWIYADFKKMCSFKGCSSTFNPTITL